MDTSRRYCPPDEKQTETVVDAGQRLQTLLVLGSRMTLAVMRSAGAARSACFDPTTSTSAVVLFSDMLGVIVCLRLFA